MKRYLRQEILPEIGPEGQAKWARAQVVVAGAGGLGSTLLPLLAGAGVGRITVFDPDRVEEHNLHRQTIYRMADLGAPKAEAAARHPSALNPGRRSAAVRCWSRAEMRQPAGLARIACLRNPAHCRCPFVGRALHRVFAAPAADLPATLRPAASGGTTSPQRSRDRGPC